METLESLTREIHEAINAYNATLTPINTTIPYNPTQPFADYNRARQASENAKANLDALEKKRFRLYRETTELRNTEFFEITAVTTFLDVDGNLLEPGWYYWFCVPGCLPDSEPFGVWDTSEEAETDAYREQYELDLQATLV